MEELKRALDFPWDKWTVFLHPAQRELVEQHFAGPARVSGSAGTGKTIVALHRAVFLARKHPDGRVLLTTFSEALATDLRTRLRRLISNEPRLGERLEVQSLDAITERLYERQFGSPKLASTDVVRGFLSQATDSGSDEKLSVNILWTEWNELVDPWQLPEWNEYRDFPRLGRKTRLPEARRAAIWAVFEGVKARLLAEGLVTRGSSAGDGRVTVVRVTPKGRAIRRRIAEVRDRHMEDVLETWSATDRASLARLLGRLVDDLRSVHYRTVADTDTTRPDTALANSEKEKLAR